MSLPRRFRVALALVLLSACAGGGSRPAFERFDPRFTPTADDYPDVPAVVLVDRGRLTFGVDTERKVPFVRLRRYRRVKILRPSGVSLSRVEVPYDPGAILRGLIAQAVQPDGRIDRADAGDQRDVRHGTGVRARRLDVPEVRVGTVIEVAYDLYRDDLRFIAPWTFQSALPTQRSEYAVVVPAGFEVDLRFSERGRFIERPPERFEVAGATRYSWSLSDLAPRFPEADMPRPALLSPRAHVLFRRANAGGRQTQGFAAWDDVAAWHLARFEGWPELGEATAAEARRVAGDAASDERALRLMEVVARDVALTELRPPLWRAPAVPPEVVLRDARGDPTTRGMLLVALLRSVGVPALPGLYAYRDRDVLLPDAPTVRSLDGVAAVVLRADGPLVLDPNQLTVSTEVPSPRLQGARIVLAREDGAEIIRVPASRPEASRTEVDLALSLDRRGDVLGTLQARLTGAEAGALRQRLLDAAPEGYASIVSSFLRRRGAALALESVTIADLRALRRPLSIQGKVRAPGAIPQEGTTLFVRVGLLIGGPSEPPRQTRRSPLQLGAPRSVRVRGTLSLPEGYEADATPPAAEHRFDGVTVALEARAETRRRLGFVRREQWALEAVPARRYPAFRRFLEDVRASEDEAFSIRRPPDRPLEY